MTIAQGFRRATRVALLTTLCIAPQLFAATYYVSTTGSDSNVGSLAKPFATFAQGQTAAVAGDTVYFRAGTYLYSTATTTCKNYTDNVNGVVLNKSGSQGKLIHYLAYPGEVPLLNFSKMTLDSCRIRGIWMEGSWIHIKGFEIVGVPQNVTVNHENWGVWVSGSFNIFEQLNIHGISGAGLFIQKGAGNLVLNTDSHDNYDSLTSNGAGQSADGFGCHIAVGDTGNVFRGCRSWNNSDDGYDFINAYAPVTIENSWAWHMGYLPGTNTAVPAGNGNGIKAGGYGIDTTLLPANPAVHKVINCLSFLNKASGIYTNHHPVSCIFYNNTSYGNHPDIDMLGINSHGASTTVGVWRNNLAYVNTLVSDSANGPSADDAHNSWNTVGLTIASADFQSVATTGMDAARKADGSLPDITFMHLTASSKLIDAGIDVGLPYAGKAPDFGAFEYGLSSSSAAISSSSIASSSSKVSSSSIATSSSSAATTALLVNHGLASYALIQTGNGFSLQGTNGLEQIDIMDIQGHLLCHVQARPLLTEWQAAQPLQNGVYFVRMSLGSQTHDWMVNRMK